MKKFLQGTALAVLFCMACWLGWLVFAMEDSSAERTPSVGFAASSPEGGAFAGEQTFLPLPSGEVPPQSGGEGATEQIEVEVESTESAPETPTVTTRLGTLAIGGKNIPIADNVDETTLEESPGHMPDTALPGETGTSVILGHRNRNHLRPLEDVEVGEMFSFAYPDGREVEYTVIEIIVYEDTADWRIPVVAEDALVLVTCYPFRYSGNAPGKFTVLGVEI